MSHQLTNNPIIKNLIGLSRHHCAQTLLSQGVGSIEFGHWLAIPSQRLLLVFRHQQCVAIDGYQLAA